MSETVKAIVRSVVTMYNTDTTSDEIRETVEKNYDEDATLSDPIVHVMGHTAIVRHFVFTKGLFDSSVVEIKSIGYEEDSRTLNIQLVLEYSRQVAWLVPVKARIHDFITLHLNHENKIVEHVDHYDIATTIKNIPVVSFMYDLARSAAGTSISLGVGLYEGIASKVSAVKHATVSS